jgi:hypothetical protein
VEPDHETSLEGSAVIRALLTKEDFLEAVRRGEPIVIHHKAKATRFHPSAQSCDHVTLEGFTETVLANDGKSGSYFSVGSRAEAEQRWSGLVDCWGGWR